MIICEPIFSNFESETPPSNSDAGSASFEPSEQGNSHVPSAPYMPVTQGAKMYDLVSRALKKDHEYVSTAIDEVDFFVVLFEISMKIIEEFRSLKFRN